MPRLSTGRATRASRRPAPLRRSPEREPNTGAAVPLDAFRNAADVLRALQARGLKMWDYLPAQSSLIAWMAPFFVRRRTPPRFLHTLRDHLDKLCREQHPSASVAFISFASNDRAHDWHVQYWVGLGDIPAIQPEDRSKFEEGFVWPLRELLRDLQQQLDEAQPSKLVQKTRREVAKLLEYAKQPY